MSGSLRVVRAQPDDIDVVLDIIEEARQWLIGRGIPEQWPEPMPREPFARRIARGEVHLACRGDDRSAAVGTFCLLPADPAVWGEQPPDAAYVHGLAVRRAAAGHGLGARLLDAAMELTAKMGRSYLRLDCWAGNEALCRYYDWLGFARRGTRDLGDGFVVQRFERRVRDTHADA